MKKKTKICEPKRKGYKTLYEKTKNELVILSEITSAMMQSLEPAQVIYTILTALTSHDGLGFNRAMFFLVDQEKQTLEGKMAIGVHSADEANKIWNQLDDNHLMLPNLIDAYDKFKNDPESKLNNIVKGISIPLCEDTGILALTILEGMPFEINTDEAKAMVNENIKDILNTDNFVTVPLKTRDRTLGVILVDNIFSRAPITKDDIRILNMFADHAALAIENSHLYEETVHLSHTDWLTGLWNTRYFNEVLKETIKKTKEDDSRLTLLMIDIDNFKTYNDTLGHQEGDQAIKNVADILNSSSRKNDFVCRYGGEEFSIIMVNTDKDDALIISERFRSEVENCFKKKSVGARHAVPLLTISLGMATFPNDAGEKNDMIRKADLALYESKQTGKNKASIYTPELDK